MKKDNKEEVEITPENLTIPEMYSRLGEVEYHIQVHESYLKNLYQEKNVLVQSIMSSLGEEK